MTSDRATRIVAMRQTHHTLTQLTSGVADAALDYRGDPEDWSVREILAHLVDDEAYVMRMRLERMLKEKRPDLAPYDQEAWYASRNTSRDALAQLLADFATQRAASLNILEMLRESDWAREGFQPEYGTLTVESWLDHWASHDATHLQQIERTLGAARAHITE